jgi:lipopolysaccharide biosynthesis protein
MNRHVNRALALIGRSYRLGSMWFRFGLGRLHPRRHYIRKIWRGSKSLEHATKVALLAHYQRQGRFFGYVQYYARALERAGFAVIVISNSPRIDAASLSQILPHSAAVVLRKNIGLDFGAWRDGLTLVPNLALLDTLFGPFRDVASDIRRCDFSAADVWGMTDSYDGRYHLQSYFLIFGRAAIANRCFSQFWERLPHVSHKGTVIRYGEIGLTQKLLAAGLRVRALFPYSRMSEAVVERFAVADDSKAHSLLADYREHLLARINAGSPLNPTHFFWDYLITDADFPFLKRELIEKNPMKIPFIASWRNALRDKSDFPVELIDEYLQHSSRNRIF